MKESQNYVNLLSLIYKIHIDCFKLCKNSLGKYLPVAGNIGIFCQTEKDFNILTELRQKITKKMDNPNQKYYPLLKPIVIPRIKNTPQAIYTHLYIRKPNKNSPQKGDIDFVIGSRDYKKLKQKLKEGIKISGASIYNRPGWDMIELKNQKINALAYIGTKEMTKNIRIKLKHEINNPK